MGAINDTLSPEAAGLRLCRIDRKDELHLYEPIMFERGRAAVEVILRRAAIAGHVEVEGEQRDLFADVMSDPDTWIQTVALDKGSFDYLRDKMRPRRSR